VDAMLVVFKKFPSRPKNYQHALNALTANTQLNQVQLLWNSAMHASPGVLYSKMIRLNVKHAMLVTTNQPFPYQLMLLVLLVKWDCTLRTKQLNVSITTTLMIASRVQRVVNSPQLLLYVKFALLESFKTPSLPMQKYVQHVLQVDI
jgi:hypothetical protein